MPRALKVYSTVYRAWPRLLCMTAVIGQVVSWCFVPLPRVLGSAETVAVPPCALIAGAQRRLGNVSPEQLAFPPVERKS